ncbi:acyl-CoA thioesterase [Flavisolibacter nicotianae]|uniref:acyl-CoA thioesterase n=1 Tax=Flavisolibacter nicotianae TaxID=2364882 RepID=UPI000EB522B1|nr:thioesterase family protein [Flavisolibacter nicotianae]
MARIKIQVPETFSFSANIPVRITDINYGGHVGNDSILSLLHEARMLFLRAAGYTELEFAGVGLIMADAAIEFKGESFYGDVLKAYVTIADFSRIGFDLYYKLVKGEEETAVAVAKTGMICFDYVQRKIAKVPEEARRKWEK